MGTRADFYVGVGPTAEWLGSVAMDGYTWAEDLDCALRKAQTIDEFRAAVARVLREPDDATTPDQGWPWPWNTSGGTDYVYWFNGVQVEFGQFDKAHNWPDMSARQNVTLGPRSGLIVGIRKVRT